MTQGLSKSQLGERILWKCSCCFQKFALSATIDRHHSKNSGEIFIAHKGVVVHEHHKNSLICENAVAVISFSITCSGDASDTPAKFFYAASVWGWHFQFRSHQTKRPLTPHISRIKGSFLGPVAPPGRKTTEKLSGFWTLVWMSRFREAASVLRYELGARREVITGHVSGQ